MAAIAGISKNSPVTMTITSDLSKVDGVRRQVSASGYNPGNIARFFAQEASVAIKDYVDTQTRLSSRAIQAIAYALGEVVVEIAKSRLPVWTGSLQQAVIFDSGVPIGSTRSRRYSVTLAIAIDPNEVRYERSSHAGTLVSLGIAENTNEKVGSYEAVRIGQTFKDRAGETHRVKLEDYQFNPMFYSVEGILGKAVRAIPGGAKAFFERGTGFLGAVIKQLDLIRGSLATANRNVIEKEAAYRIQLEMDARSEKARANADAKAKGRPGKGSRRKKG